MSRGAVVKIEHRDSACALAKTPCSCLIEDANYSNELPTDPSRCCVGAGGSGIDAPVLLLMCSLAGLSRVSSDPVEFGGDADPDSGNVHGFDDAAQGVAEVVEADRPYRWDRGTSRDKRSDGDFDVGPFVDDGDGPPLETFESGGLQHVLDHVMGVAVFQVGRCVGGF